MSKRFGRNQRRRQNDEIERLRLALDRESRLRDHMRGIMDDQRGTLDRVLDLLGRNHVLAAPREIDAQPDSAGTVRLPAVEPLRHLSTADHCHQAAMRIHQLTCVMADTELDRLRDMIHVRVRTPQGRMCAAIAAETLRRMGRRQAAKWLAEDIAYQLTKELPV